MKKIIILTALMLVTSVSVMAQGVNFKNGSLKELLAQAKSADKYLFVDVYTTWCGPCKYMTNNVFPQAKVGEYFNNTFVNAKFDAEKGEGIDVARKYGVKAYPTFLILNAEGVEVGRIVGGGDADDFIKKTQGVVKNINK